MPSLVGSEMCIRDSFLSILTLPAGAQALQNLAAIQPGQAEIKNSQVIFTLGQQAIGNQAIVGNIDEIPGMAQGAPQAIGQQGVVFNQQYAHRVVRNRSG
eukprot:TRINITY_DN14905_c0_g1_i1.p3 TRINITY_DN14905_c0_g1~~TRINITY_DN14905_c0_g1_i1.p3  ORF type:complete len:100 (+),score=17.29 TRINITY_DN14905_c0_g1_i1:103-402(+)